MKEMISSKIGRLLSLWMVFLLGAGMICAPLGQAKVYISDGSDDAVEGDPLDANDWGGGGSPIGGDIEDSFKVIVGDGGGVVISGPRHETQVFLIIDFRGKVPVLQVIRVSGSVVLAEDPDAR